MDAKTRLDKDPPLKNSGDRLLMKWGDSKLGAGLPPDAKIAFGPEFFGEPLANALNTGAGSMTISLAQFQPAAKAGKWEIRWTPSASHAGLPTKLSDASAWAGMIVFNIQKMCEIDTAATKAICDGLLSAFGWVDNIITDFQTDIMTGRSIPKISNIGWGRRGHKLYNAAKGTRNAEEAALAYLKDRYGDTKPLINAWQVDYSRANAWSGAPVEPYDGNDWKHLHEAVTYGNIMEFFGEIDTQIKRAISYSFSKDSDRLGVDHSMSGIAKILEQESSFCAKMVVSGVVHDYDKVRDQGKKYFENLNNVARQVSRYCGERKRDKVQSFLSGMERIETVDTAKRREKPIQVSIRNNSGHDVKIVKVSPEQHPGTPTVVPNGEITIKAGAQFPELVEGEFSVVQIDTGSTLADVGFTDTDMRISIPLNLIRGMIVGDGHSFKTFKKAGSYTYPRRARGAPLHLGVQV
ncbi:hypothetical protein OG906_40415 (plasmid) [Streptomyces sp. NBC_01426]|uniref:hypothetical protein n=1 Tax=Streptomyces sp. NBC_01426 TaxID=2975866 RepID=UPI002E30F748|nr:hypothetical protein [Streptomyces sp. NBC_01426]